MVFNKRLLLIGLLIVASCQNRATQEQILKTEERAANQFPRVIYGDDNRLDYFEASDFWRSKANSTFALVKSNQLIDLGNGFQQLKGENFGTSFNLCDEEPFREQTKAAFCSGFLVTPNIMVTAGHCMRSSFDCNGTKFIFGFAISQKNVEPTQISSSDVYSCKQIIKSVQESNGADFSVVRLDRDVPNRASLPLHTGVLSSGDPLLVVGYPSGIPVKISGGASVRTVNPKFYVANLDTYGGNSGSAVFNEATGEVEGILVRGETDFIYKNGCRVSNRCANESCRGEDVTRIDQVLPYISN